jgi:tRNA nucleotidyltransferase/poly(A) polymerase
MDTEIESLEGIEKYGIIEVILNGCNKIKNASSIAKLQTLKRVSLKKSTKQNLILPLLKRIRPQVLLDDVYEDFFSVSQKTKKAHNHLWTQLETMDSIALQVKKKEEFPDRLECSKTLQ